MSKIYTPTHREGCEIAARYLHKQLNCGAVFIEPNPFNNRESPDAIGFRPGGCSILMEVKVNRGDFLVDKKKPHRINPADGMGSYRFYVCPEDVIRIEDLPERWGLFYFTSRKSLRPVHVPKIQFTSLSSPENMKRWVEDRNDSGFMTSPYHKSCVEMLKDFAHFEKNVAAEQNILYGAWRQLCIAQQRSIPYTVNEVFQRPEL